MRAARSSAPAAGRTRPGRLTAVGRGAACPCSTMGSARRRPARATSVPRWQTCPGRGRRRFVRWTGCIVPQPVPPRPSRSTSGMSRPISRARRSGPVMAAGSCGGSGRSLAGASALAGGTRHGKSPAAHARGPNTGADGGGPCGRASASRWEDPRGGAPRQAGADLCARRRQTLRKAAAGRGRCRRRRGLAGGPRPAPSAACPVRSLPRPQPVPSAAANPSAAGPQGSRPNSGNRPRRRRAGPERAAASRTAARRRKAGAPCRRAGAGPVPAGRRETGGQTASFAHTEIRTFVRHVNASADRRPWAGGGTNVGRNSTWR